MQKFEFAFSFSYPTRPNVPVLSDISFGIKSGETVALVGPSGAGKSSIIQLIEHFYETNKGSIKLDGVEISQYDHGYVGYLICNINLIVSSKNCVGCTRAGAI